MQLPITIEPNPILHQISKELNSAQIQNANTQKFIADMIETMYAKDGAGLAAPQVGRSIRLCIIGKAFNDLNKNKSDLTLINPVWTKKTIVKTTDMEGCLSIPNLYGKVKRYKKITVQALDKNGQPLNFTASDFFARAIQHEVDHLDGVLFTAKATGLIEINKQRERL